MKEALKLALEFLEDNEHYVAENERHIYVLLYNEVIKKCKAALAQPAQQEPVAWMRGDGTLRFAEGKVFAVNQPFYTTPPQRKPLTKTEIDECIEAADTNWADASVPFEWAKQFTQAVEAAHGIKEQP